jgi:hypothetical protein
MVIGDTIEINPSFERVGDVDYERALSHLKVSLKSSSYLPGDLIHE